MSYTATGAAPAVKILGTIEQSGVEDDFSAEVPVEIQFATGETTQTIWVQTSGDDRGVQYRGAAETNSPMKVSIPAGRGVLAVKK